MEFWKKHKTLIITAVVVALLLTIGLIVWMNWDQEPKNAGRSSGGYNPGSSGGGSPAPPKPTGSSVPPSNNTPPPPPASTSTQTATSTKWTDSNYTGKGVYLKEASNLYGKPVMSSQNIEGHGDPGEYLGEATGTFYKSMGYVLIEYTPDDFWTTGKRYVRVALCTIL